MKGFTAFLAFFGVAAGVAVAQVPLEPLRSRGEITTLLHLDADRAARVNTILDTAREKARVAREQIGPTRDETTRSILYAALEAIRADTEEKLGAVLSDEELARLLAYLPAPPSRHEPLRFRRV